MRCSRYAVEALGPRGNRLLYNVANGAFVEIGQNAFSTWRSAREAGEVTEGAGLTDLARLGFLTDLSAEEELALQQRLFDAERTDPSKLTLSFVPTYACNFRCPYCYELGHNKIPGAMDGRIMDAVMRFVQDRHDDMGFTQLSVQWYGGDPSLVLDVVEELSGRLIAWCEARGVAYDAMMLTNANVIDEQAVDLIERCRVSMAYLTIDGPEEIHNRRRVAANGSNSYERVIQAARLLRVRGVELLATMNTDKVNIVYYEQLSKRLLEEEGIYLSMAKLNDYGHFFGEAPFCAPDFDLFTHEEFFKAQFLEFAKRDHHAAELRDMLRPVRRFCSGQHDTYFIIDVRGDVYKCDGRVGEQPYVLFNVLDEKAEWKLHEITFDPTRDEKCGPCELLPVCLGNCLWERECSGMPCHPFKTTLDSYLGVYLACLENETGLQGDALAQELSANDLVVWAQPYTPEELGWTSV